MRECTICYMSPRVRHKCGCLYCIDCLLGWFEEQEKGKHVENLNCLNKQACFGMGSFTIPDLLLICQKQPYQEKLQSILMKRYLKNSDVRSCPSGNCNNYGFIDTQKCNEQLQCNLCFYQWSDYSLLPLSRIISINISNIGKNLRNQLFYWNKTQYCPNCFADIQKNGGCSHMTCIKCKHYFCWHCKGVIGKGHAAQCSSHTLIYQGSIIVLFINLLYSLGLLYYFSYLIVPFKYLFILILPHLTVIVGCVSLGAPLYIYIYRNSFRRQLMPSLLILALSIAGLVFAYLCDMLIQEFMEFTIYNYIALFFVEACIVIAIIGTCILKNYLIYLLLIPLAILCYYFEEIFVGIGLILWVMPILFKLFRKPIPRVMFVFHLLYYPGLYMLDYYDLQTIGVVAMVVTALLKLKFRWLSWKVRRLFG